MTEPTDAELKAMWQLHAADIGGIFCYARAVLAKWGQPAQAAEPVAVLKFERGTPGRQNEMPRVVSCNWMPDGEYEVYLAAAPTTQPAPGEQNESAYQRGYMDGMAKGRRDVEAAPQQEAQHLAQALTDRENQPNQYGVEFGMSGTHMHFKVGNQLFKLAYEPDEQEEFDFMKRMLVNAFTTFTHDVKTAPQPVEREPVAWKHDCAALLTNDVELWIDACPHCGKPRNAPQPVARESLTDEWIRSRCKESWIFDTAKQWVRMTEAAHGIKGGQHGTE